MIIADSTPLINFAAIYRLDILEQLFTKVVIDQGRFFDLGGIYADERRRFDRKWVKR